MRLLRNGSVAALGQPRESQLSKSAGFSRRGEVEGEIFAYNEPTCISMDATAPSVACG